MLQSTFDWEDAENVHDLADAVTFLEKKISVNYWTKFHG